jgi:AcrR family transcriptional regulator
MSENKVAQRQERALQNDDRILKSAISILAEDGWDELTFANVSRRAELSSRPVRLRYSSPTELVQDLYSRRLEGLFFELIERLHSAHQSNNRDRVEDTTEAMLLFASDSKEKQALAEVLLISSYEPEIKATVDQNLKPKLEVWLGTVSDLEVQTHFALLLMVSLGFLVENREGSISANELRNMVRRLIKDTEQAGPAKELPEIHAPHLDHIANIDTGDKALDDLLLATLEELSLFGISKSTIVRIASRCNRTEGFIFSRYATKNDLIVDAVKYSLLTAFKLNNEFQYKLFETFSAPEVFILTIREFMHPKHATQRTLAFEEIRLSWRNQAIRAVYRGEQESVFSSETDEDLKAKLMINVSLGVGVMILAHLLPDSWKLPYIIHADGLVAFFE